MTTSEGSPTVPIDPRESRETIVSPRASEPGSDANTIDLRDTVLVPAQGRPAAPAVQPVELLRFGPGVPAVIAATTATVAVAGPATAPAPAQPKRLRRNRALNLALTLALAAVVVWWLWPAGSLRVQTVSVKATPAVVACDSTADVIATVRTNGNSGHLTYRWTRGDGVGSGTLVQSLARGQHSVELHLTWAFHGPGSYDARASVRLLSPGTSSAAVSFRYVC
jgi:hypothetical protein